MTPEELREFLPKGLYRKWLTAYEKEHPNRKTDTWFKLGYLRGRTNRYFASQGMSSVGGGVYAAGVQVADK